MRNSNATVTIAEPCMQNWADMEKGKDFGFCNACKKNVIDFTAYTNAEIIAVLTQSSTSVCGRLSEMQLNQLNYCLLVKPKNKNWLKYLGVLTIGASIFSQDTKAADLPVFTSFTIPFETGKADDKPTIVNQVSGRILGPDKKPQAGIRLVILNTRYYAMTDQNGKYKITFDKGINVKNNTFSVQSARFSATTIINYAKVEQSDIVLNEEPMIMGLIVVKQKKRG